MDRLKRSLRATFAGLAVNIVLAVAKLLAGLFGHSQALIADAIESFADIFSSIVVWRGLVIAAEPPDEDHPYGHAKAEAISGAIVSGVLLAAAGWIVLNSALEMRSRHEPPAAFTLLVLLVVVIVKEALFRFADHEGRAVDSPAVKSDAWHHRSDAITSIGAGIGITIALIGGKGFEKADDIAAIAAGLVVAWNGWHVLKPVFGELMDTSASKDVINRIRRIAGEVAGVENVEKCLVRKAGNEYFVDMHIEVDPQMTVLVSHQIAHNVKDRIREKFPAVHDVLIHIEPKGIAAKTTQNAG